MLNTENSFERLFNILVKSLNKFSIPYIIVGGAVVPYYGNIRSTQDIDTMIMLDNTDNQSIKDWLMYLKGERLSLDVDEITSALDQNIHSTIFDEDSFVFRIDLKKVFSKYDYLSYLHRKEVVLFEQIVYISSPESLLGIKMSNGFQSNTDIEDVLTIIETTELDIQELLEFLDQGESKNNLCGLLKKQESEKCRILFKKLQC